MKLAFMASDAIALDSIKFLHDSSQWQLSCIVSNPDKPKGRGQKLQPNEVSAWALENGVELLRPEKSPREPELTRFRQLGVEMIIVMAYGHILKNDVLGYSKYPCLNLHASILPNLRGASPVETALALGLKETGVSLMKISPAMDEGDVCAVEKISIGEFERAAQVRKKIAAASTEILRKYLSEVVDEKIKFIPQQNSLATYTRKLNKEDLFIDFKKSAREIFDRIRAFGCGIFESENLQYKIGDARVVDCENKKFECGQIICASPAEGLLIGCGSGVLEVLQIQKPCAKMLPAKIFLEGTSFEKSILLKSFDNKNLLRGV